MAECEHLTRTSAYFDGELPEAEHEATLAHVATCAECQSLLGTAASLDAVVSRAPRTATVPARSRRRSLYLAGGAGVAAAAAIALWFARKPHTDKPPAQIAVALPAERAVEARFSGEMFQAYRPRSVMRGDAHPHETIALAVLADLEKRGDKRDLVAALASSGDVARAQELAATLPVDPEGESDRAALSLVAGDPERALVHAYHAIDKAPQLAAAWWNLGLAARDLGLPRVAEDAFTRVAKANEAGWSKDAAGLAVDPELRREREFDAFFAQGTAMIAGGAKIDPARVAEYPAYSRMAFYDALRVAASPADVEALRSLARALDADSNTKTASAAADRVAGADFAVRGKYIADYRALAAHTLAADRTQPFLAELKAAGAPAADIYVGALILAGQTTGHLTEIRTLVAPWQDPWFDLFVEREQIRGAYPVLDERAETRLLAALDACGNPAWSLRCGGLAEDLAKIQFATGRDDDAEARARTSVELFTRAGNPMQIPEPRALLADIHRRRGRFALARAEFDEVARAAGDKLPALRRFAQIGQANVAFAARDFAATRALLPPAEDPCCAGSDPIGLATAVDLARITGDDKDRVAALEWVRHAHDTGDEMLARIGSARLDDADSDFLHKGLSEAAQRDPTAQGYRAYAYATLISSAGEHQQWDRVIDLALEEHPLGKSACLVVASSDDDWVTVAVRTPDGTLGETKLITPTETGVLPEIISPQLVAAVKSCDGIPVIARPPLHGRGDLLPPELPWWFAGDSHPGSAPPPPADRRAVQVLDARPPDPTLPRLPDLAPSHERFDVTLAGEAATPARVISALGDATYAELHAHGIVAAADTSAAYLALSPDASGAYALHADAIRKAHFSAAPLVVLAACRAAVVAPLQRQRWSLPDAFLAAGARAVIAADIAIPDAQAREVFDDLHHRIAAGAPVAKALAELRSARGGWASHLMLFQ
jgi:hypothetical protein